MNQRIKKVLFLLRFRLDKEMRPIRSSLDEDINVVVIAAAGDDGPQGSHKICKDAPREVANALISAWTPLLLMASNRAIVLEAGEINM
jgi:hypothetical protein